jgi:hypothetical protein
LISYWEQAELLHADITIVGGGITGLSIAASLLERDATRQVRVIERSSFPYGASTRNAGFACFGSPTEFTSDIALMGVDAARELVFNRWLGIQITRKRLKDADIGFVASGGFELVDGQSISGDQLNELNGHVSDFLPNYFTNATDQKPALGLEAAGDLIAINGEGQVNSGKLIRSLRQYVSGLGAELINGAEVLALHPEKGVQRIALNDPVRGRIDLSSAKVVVANNAFASQLIPALNVKPGRGQVLLTASIPDLRFKGNLHIEEGFYYLRDVGDRIMFGGGRNLDQKGEETTEQGLTDTIQSALESYLVKLFGRSFPIEQRWSGTMGFTGNKQPMIERAEDGIWVVAGLSGMGIALAGFLGEELADSLSACE